MIQLAFFRTSRPPIDAGILSPLSSANNHFPSVAATYSTKSNMSHAALSPCSLTSLPAHISSSVGHDAF